MSKNVISRRIAKQYIYFKHSFVNRIRIYLYYSVPTIHEYRRPKIFVYEKFPKTEDRRSSPMKNFRRPKTEYIRSWIISEYRRPNTTLRSQLFANTEESEVFGLTLKKSCFEEETFSLWWWVTRNFSSKMSKLDVFVST